MDRLTRIIEDGPIKVLSICQARCGEATVWKEWSVSKDGAIKDALLRLAAYEDTGLEPSEIKTAVMFWGENAAQAQAQLSAYRTAEEQRNKGCDFCNGHEHYHFYAGYSQQLDVVDKFVEREIEEINFCPMCGRALKGGE